MKFIVILLFLISTNSFAITCNQYEAQIIVDVESIETINNGCLIKPVKSFTHYSGHIFCPLLIEELQQGKILLTGAQCDQVNLTRTISGIAVKDLSEQYIKIER